MSLNTDSQPVEGQQVPSAVRSHAPGWIYPGLIVLVAGVLGTFLAGWVSPSLGLVAPIGIVAGLVLAIRSTVAASKAHQHIWGHWLSWVAGIVAWVVCMIIFTVALFASAASQATNSPSVTADTSRPVVTEPVDLVAQYADNYPATQAERFAVVATLTSDFIPGGFDKASLADNGGRAESFMAQYYHAAYRYHDPRYLWAIVNDPATSPLYQKLKTLPQEYQLEQAAGDPGLETLEWPGDAPVRDIGPIKLTYTNGQSETVTEWAFRFMNDHWIVAIGGNSL